MGVILASLWLELIYLWHFSWSSAYGKWLLIITFKLFLFIFWFFTECITCVPNFHFPFTTEFAILHWNALFAEFHFPVSDFQLIFQQCISVFRFVLFSFNYSITKFSSFELSRSPLGRRWHAKQTVARGTHSAALLGWWLCAIGRPSGAARCSQRVPDFIFVSTIYDCVSVASRMFDVIFVLQLNLCLHWES